MKCTNRVVCIATLLIFIIDCSNGMINFINITLTDGQSSNEGQIAYQISVANGWEAACGTNLGFYEAVLICRQLGYPGANNAVKDWPSVSINTSFSLSQKSLDCMHQQAMDLGSCNLVDGSPCSNRGGAICYDHGYEGCYSHTGSPGQVLTSECRTGSQNMTIANCVSMCRNTNKLFIFAGVTKGGNCYCGFELEGDTDMDDLLCASLKCTGRDIESCGGPLYIAVFNVSRYLENNNLNTNIGTCGEESAPPTNTSLTRTSPTSASLTRTFSAITSPTITSPTITSSTRTNPTSAPQSVSVTYSGGEGSSDGVGDTTPIQTSTVASPGDAQKSVSDMNGLFIGVGVGGAILVIIIIVLLALLMKRKSGEKSREPRDMLSMSVRSEPDGGNPRTSVNDYVFTNPDAEYSFVDGTGQARRNPEDITGRPTSADADGVYAAIDDGAMTPDNIARNGRQQSRRPREATPDEADNPKLMVDLPDYHVLEADGDEIPCGKVVDLPLSKKRDDEDRYSIPQYAMPVRNPEPTASEVQDDFSNLYSTPDKSTKRNKTAASGSAPLDRDPKGSAMDNILYHVAGPGSTLGSNATGTGGTVGYDNDNDGTVMVENELYAHT